MDTEQKQQSRKRGNPVLVTGVIVVVVIILAIAGYYLAKSVISPAPTPIGKILGDLRTWDGQIVTVRGEVTSRVKILGFKAYELTDDSGQIMIVTERGVPNAGETVTVTGVVNEVFSMGQLTKTVIMEPAEID